MGMRTGLEVTMIVAGAWAAGVTVANAQTTPPAASATDADQHRISSQDLDLMRKDIRSQKKQLIAQNLKLTDAEMEVDVAAAQLRAKYLPMVSQAIAGRKGATFAQLDRRISLMIELQLSPKVPLVQSQ
jgi:hypothetical protein